MPNIEITNCDAGSVVVEIGGTQDGILKNAVAEEVVFREGTILTQHADTKFYPWDPASVVGDVGLFVLTYDVTIGISLEAGVQVLAAGKVNQNRLVIHDETPITSVHLSALRNFAIVPVDVVQLGTLDNPQS